MRIFDCFLYSNEDLILDIRLNSLYKYVYKFVIVEAKYDHQGNEKNYNFKIENFNKFKDKINYIQIEKFPQNFTNWERENYHRNYITNGLTDAGPDDYIMISDVDEIPKIDLFKPSKKKYTAFKQKMFYYKFNLLNTSETPWWGTRMCKKKYLKSPQLLRMMKVKKYSIFKFYKNVWNIIDDGGWHFTYMMTPEKISQKLKSFAHSEYNKPIYTNIESISEKIKNKKDLFGRNFKFIQTKNFKDLPDYIQKNKEKFLDYLL